MPRLDGFPYGLPTIRVPRMRVYENAAVNRKGRLTYIPGQMFVLPPEAAKTLSDLTYTSPLTDPFRKADSQAYLLEFPRESSAAEENGEGIPLSKWQTALQAYRVGSGKGMAPAVNIDAIIGNLIAESASQDSIRLPDELVNRYRQKREEEIQGHDRYLWKRFRLRHMLYVDKDTLYFGMRSHHSGEILNVRV